MSLSSDFLNKDNNNYYSVRRVNFQAIFLLADFRFNIAKINILPYYKYLKKYVDFELLD